MLKVIGFALLIFSGFFVAGYQTAVNDLQEEDYLETYLFDQVNYRIEGEKASLFIDVGDNSVFLYNVDTNKVENVPLTHFIMSQDNEDSLVQIFSVEGELLSSFIGGASLGFTFKDFKDIIRPLSKIQPRSAVKIAVSIVSTIIGYGFGYWVAEKLYTPKLDSDAVLEMLSNDAVWLKNEFGIFAKSSAYINYRDKLKQEASGADPEPILIGKIKQYLRDNSITNDFSSKDFLFLNALALEVGVDKSTEELQEERSYSKIKWLTYLVWIVLGGFFLLFLMLFMHDKFKSLVAKFKRPPN